MFGLAKDLQAAVNTPKLCGFAVNISILVETSLVQCCFSPWTCPQVNVQTFICTAALPAASAAVPCFGAAVFGSPSGRLQVGAPTSVKPHEGRAHAPGARTHRPVSRGVGGCRDWAEAWH